MRYKVGDVVKIRPYELDDYLYRVIEVNTSTQEYRMVRVHDNDPGYGCTEDWAKENARLCTPPDPPIEPLAQDLISDYLLDTNWGL